MGLLDLLCGPIYERFRRAAATHRRFLQQLEPYILHGKLPRVTPAVLLALAHHHAARGSLRHLEARLRLLGP